MESAASGLPSLFLSSKESIERNLNQNFSGKSWSIKCEGKEFNLKLSSIRVRPLLRWEMYSKKYNMSMDITGPQSEKYNSKNILSKWVRWGSSFLRRRWMTFPIFTIEPVPKEFYLDFFEEVSSIFNILCIDEYDSRLPPQQFEIDKEGPKDSIRLRTKLELNKSHSDYIERLERIPADLEDLLENFELYTSNAILNRIGLQEDSWWKNGERPSDLIEYLYDDVPSELVYKSYIRCLEEAAEPIGPDVKLAGDEIQLVRNYDPKENEILPFFKIDSKLDINFIV